MTNNQNDATSQVRDVTRRNKSQEILDQLTQLVRNADCFNMCVVICTLIPVVFILALIVPKTMADDGITTIEEVMKVLLDARANCHRSLAADVPPKMPNGDYYEVYCPGEWDELLCWPNSPPGKIKTISCPKYIEDFDHTGFARRYCLPDGQWAKVLQTNRTWAHYNDCSKAGTEDWVERIKEGDPQSRSLIQLYTVGYSFSLVALIFAIIILGYFKRLHCTRNYIHMHLFASFILRAAVIFVKDRVLFYGSGILDVQTQDGEPSLDMLKTSVDEATAGNNSYLIGCRIVMTLFHYCLSTNYYWILVEALYLHSLIFVAFFSDKKYLWRFTIIGWGVPVLFVVPWAIVRATLGDTSCWDIAVAEYKWIYSGPIVVANVINFLLFLNIIRVLWYKMRERGLVSRQGRTDNRRQYKKLAKSTLVLIPMFGVHAIVFIGMPDHITTGTWWAIRMYFDLFFNSFQGFFVAIIYCFCNGEVQAEFKKAWERFNLSVEIQRGRRERSRSSVTMLTTFNSSGSHQGRLSLSGVSNGRGSTYRSNGSLLTRNLTTNNSEQKEKEAISMTEEMETTINGAIEESRNTNENGRANESAPLMTSRRSLPPFIRMQSGTFPVRGAADVILPIAEEIDLEEEFEAAVEDHAHDQISCPAKSFDILAVENDEHCDEEDDKLCDVIGHDENSAASRKRRSCVKRAESEDSGISSNFFSSIRRGSGGRGKINGSPAYSDYCGDSAASGSDVENAFEGGSDITEKPDEAEYLTTCSTGNTNDDVSVL